jgi:hypothetical protein
MSALDSVALGNINEAAAREACISRILILKTTALRDKMRADSLLAGLATTLRKCSSDASAASASFSLGVSAVRTSASSSNQQQHPASPSSDLSVSSEMVADGASLLHVSSITSSSFASNGNKNCNNNSSNASHGRRRVRWDSSVDDAHQSRPPSNSAATAAATTGSSSPFGQAAGKTIIFTDRTFRQHLQTKNSNNTALAAAAATAPFFSAEEQQQFIINIPDLDPAHKKQQTLPLIPAVKIKPRGPTKLTMPFIEDEIHTSLTAADGADDDDKENNSVQKAEATLFRLMAQQYDPLEVKKAKDKRRDAQLNSKKARQLLRDKKAAKKSSSKKTNDPDATDDSGSDDDDNNSLLLLSALGPEIEDDAEC